MDPQTQFFMDPQSGMIVNGLGQPVQVPPGMAPVPAPQMQPAPSGGGAQGLLRREVQGVPLWAWLLGVGAIAGGGYYLYTRAQAGAGDGGGDDSDETPKVRANRSRRALPSGDDHEDRSSSSSRRSSWSPSRSRIADRTKKWLSERDKATGTTIFVDADEAMAKGVKNPSPLVNIKVKSNSDLDKDADFKKWVRREGLNPVRIDKTTVGLVPADNTKRGIEWEGYVDALREEGQKV